MLGTILKSRKLARKRGKAGGETWKSSVNTTPILPRPIHLHLKDTGINVIIKTTVKNILKEEKKIVTPEFNLKFKGTLGKKRNIFDLIHYCLNAWAEDLDLFTWLSFSIDVGGSGVGKVAVIHLSWHMEGGGWWVTFYIFFFLLTSLFCCFLS